MRPRIVRKIGVRVDAVFAEIRGLGAWGGALALILVAIVIVRLARIAERSGRPLMVKFLGVRVDFGVKSNNSVGPAWSTSAVDPIVRQALEAIERRDWVALKPLLHPYLHWTEGDHTIRGRTKVLAHLETLSTVDAPIETELRDNQVYRWTVLPK